MGLWVINGHRDTGEVPRSLAFGLMTGSLVLLGGLSGALFAHGPAVEHWILVPRAAWPTVQVTGSGRVFLGVRVRAPA